MNLSQKKNRVLTPIFNWGEDHARRSGMNLSQKKNRVLTPIFNWGQNTIFLLARFSC